MNWWRKVKIRLRALFQKRKLDTEMDEEMRSHIEMQTQENLDAGMSVTRHRDNSAGWSRSRKRAASIGE